MIGGYLFITYFDPRLREQGKVHNKLATLAGKEQKSRRAIAAAMAKMRASTSGKRGEARICFAGQKSYLPLTAWLISPFRFHLLLLCGTLAVDLLNIFVLLQNIFKAVVHGPLPSFRKLVDFLLNLGYKSIGIFLLDVDSFFSAIKSFFQLYISCPSDGGGLNLLPIAFGYCYSIACSVSLLG